MTPDKDDSRILPSDAYVAIVCNGYCKVCEMFKDLRCGACFHCASGNVCGEKIDGGHKLWQADKPENFWFVRAS